MERKILDGESKLEIRNSRSSSQKSVAEVLIGLFPDLKRSANLRFLKSASMGLINSSRKAGRLKISGKAKTKSGSMLRASSSPRARQTVTLYGNTATHASGPALLVA